MLAITVRTRYLLTFVVTIRLQENHKYHIRIFAKNEVGISEPLETEEPYTIQKPTGKSGYTSYTHLGYNI